MNFSRDTYASQLGRSFTMSASGWTPSSPSPGNQSVAYSGGGYNYVSWSPENSVMKNDLGMLLSCKLDLKNTAGDDHIILLTGFMIGSNKAKKLVLVQASVQFAGNDDSANNIMSDPMTVEADHNRDLAQAMYDYLYATINDLGSGFNTGGRITLPNLAKTNINALSAAVS